MNHIGELKLEQTIDLKFLTCTSAGVPTTLAGSPVISAYPGNSTTQLTAGITLSVDFDSVTGLNNVRVVATNANGYAAGTDYQLVITTGTVSGVSVVGYVVGSFSIENRVVNIASVPALSGAYPAFGIAASGTAQGGSSTTIQLASSTNFTADNRPGGFTVYIVSGTGGGQSRVINSYVNSSDTATVDAWVTNPDSSSVYIVFASAPISSTGVSINAASLLAALGMSTGNMDTQLAALSAQSSNIQTRIPTALVNDHIKSTGSLTEAITESYSALNAAPTPIQMMLEIRQFLMAAAASGSAITVNKIDGVTPAFTLALDASYPAQLPLAIARDT